VSIAADAVAPIGVTLRQICRSAQSGFSRGASAQARSPWAKKVRPALRPSEALALCREFERMLGRQTKRAAWDDRISA
jgi:hypothetical protein